MSEALKSVGAITLFVEDLPAARSFYERVFGRTAAFEDDNSAAFKFDNALINLVDTRHSGPPGLHPRYKASWLTCDCRIPQPASPAFDADYA